MNPATLPSFSRTPDAYLHGFFNTLRMSDERVAEVVRQGSTHFDRVLAVLEKDQEEVSRAYSPIGHLAAVTSSPEWQRVESEADAAYAEYITGLGQNIALSDLVKGVDAESLSGAQLAVLKHWREFFEDSGVALDADGRARFTEISKTLSALAVQFNHHLQGSIDEFRMPLAAEEVAALPAAVAGLFKTEHAEHFEAMLILPHVDALLTYSPNRALREKVWRAHNTLASAAGVGGEDRNNLPIILQTLQQREELARVRGFEDYAAMTFARRACPGPAVAQAFLEDLRAKIRPQAIKEMAELREFAAQSLGIADLQPWDVRMASERLRAHKHDFSEIETMPYFSLPRVVEGMLAVAGELFGVQFKEQPAPAWNEAVRFFSVLRDGKEVSAFYLDPHARAGKRGGAWMDVCRQPTEGQLPIAFLCCNSAAPAEGKPGLLKHSEVVTLFHEFGHGLHLLLGRVTSPALSMNAVERDAIELPSQFLENFAWDPQVLARLARHVDTDAPLPSDLLDRMVAAKSFQVGMALTRQMGFGLMDLALHSGPPPRTEEELRAKVAATQGATAVTPTPPEGDQMFHAFTHVFSGGYAAGYYGYLWAEAMSADCYARFREEGSLNPELGRAFSRDILEVGASRPAQQSFEAFRQRPLDASALLKSRGIAEPASPRPGP